MARPAPQAALAKPAPQAALAKPAPQAAFAKPAPQATLAKQDALQKATPRLRFNPLAVGEAMAPLLMVRGSNRPDFINAIVLKVVRRHRRKLTEWPSGVNVSRSRASSAFFDLCFSRISGSVGAIGGAVGVRRAATGVSFARGTEQPAKEACDVS